MGFSIRDARESDAPQTAVLINAIIEEGKYTALTEPFTVESQKALIQRVLKHGTYLVAVEGDEVLGVQLVLPLSDLAAFSHVGDIGTYVSTAAHRKGVGRALADATFLRAKEVGFSKILAFIRGDNTRAQAFYQNIGFQPIGIAHRQALIRGEYIDEVLMERFL